MDGSKTSAISNAVSDREIGEYWDDHDLSDHSDTGRPVSMDVDIRSSVIYFAIDRLLAEKLRSAAENRGLSPESLLDDWVRERVAIELSR
jgi:hypothetical protein